MSCPGFEFPDRIGERAGIDFVVTASLSEVAEASRRRSVLILWIAPDVDPAGSIEHVLCLAPGDRARRVIGRFLRDQVGSPIRVTALLDRVSDDIVRAEQ